MGYWSPVSRSLRHPFKGPRRYLRPERSRNQPRKQARQPKMRQSRFSVESVLEAPDTTAARPGLRLRVTGLVVVLLFALLGLRLWTLQVLQAPAAAHAVNANQIRTVPVEPARGLILDRYGNPLVNNVVVQQITLSQVAAKEQPEVVGRLAALIGQTTAQIEATLNDPRFSPYKPVPVLDNAPLSDILYIKEHQDDFPGVSSVADHRAQLPPAGTAGPGPARVPGGPDARLRLDHQQPPSSSRGRPRATSRVTPSGSRGSSTSTSPSCAGPPAARSSRSTRSGRVVGTLKTTPSTAGDNVVTNLDTNLQQVADNALATQIGTLRNTFDPACNNKSGCYPAATEGAVVVMDPQTGAVYAMSSYPSYNLSEWVGGLSAAQNAQLFGPTSMEPTLNRAIQGRYTPGSTFKLNTATAALNTGLITPTTPYYDTGTFKTPDCQSTAPHASSTTPPATRAAPSTCRAPSACRATTSSTTSATSSTPRLPRTGRRRSRTRRLSTAWAS